MHPARGSVGPQRDSVSERHRAQIASMLAVSHAVATGSSLSEILDTIAREAAEVTEGASASSILLRVGRDWRFAGGYGLSPEYAPLVRRTIAGINGVLSAYVVEHNEVVVISDTETDPRFVPWREGARFEGYRSTASLPLGAGERGVGALNIYRREPGGWDEEEVRLMQFFAEHAYAAIRTAQLFEQEREQVGALRRLVRTLEEQGHEHANRLQALSGLLALQEYEEAEQYLESLEVVHRRARGALGSRVRHPILAGLLVAEASIAHQRGIELTVDPASRRVDLPPSLSETQLLTIVGNLLDNAFDAVADVEPERRRVWLSLSTDGTSVTIEVRDWGRGVAPEEERLIFERGISGKEDHAGVGLALVESAVSLGGGSIALERHDEGTSMIVTLPLV